MNPILLRTGNRGLSPFFRSPCCLLWLLVVTVLLMGMSSAAMAVTVSASPGTCASVAGIGTVAWRNPTRAVSSNNTYATASVDGTTTRYLECTNYGFAIPAGAIINGITVNVERSSSSTSNGGSNDAAMLLVKAGTIGSTDRSTGTIYTTLDVVEAHGNATDLWGDTWTAADINNANFGAAFAATKASSVGSAQTVSVDWIQIVVDYTLAPTVTSINTASTNPTATATAVAWTVVFSASVTGVDVTDFGLVQGGGVSGATITSVTGSGTTWTVNANTGSGTGTLGLNLVDDDTIINGSGTPLGGVGSGNGNFTGQVYTVSPPFCSPPSNIPAGVTVSCQCDTFVRATLNPSTIFNSNWIVSTSDATGIVPSIVNSGYLRLTNSTGNNAKAATVPGIFPAAGNYISVEFQQYAYSGTGADGIAVTLSDYSVPAVPGAFGGSLGYAQKTGAACPTAPCNGFAGGWIGVALDEFGNYQNPTEGRIGGPGSVPQSVGIRGSGSGVLGYNYLAGTSPSFTAPNTIDNAGSATPSRGYYYQVIVDARNAANTAVAVNRDTTSGTGASYTSLISIPNIFTAATAQGFTQAAVPSNWQISFTGSTGGSTNIHEIGGLRICAQTMVPPSGGTAGSFNAIDEAYGTPPLPVQNYLTSGGAGRIYTKLVGTPFKLNVAVLNNGQLVTTYAAGSAKTVTVNLVDNSDSLADSTKDCTLSCTSTCTGKAAVAGGTQSLIFAAGATDKGQKQSTNFTINSAYQKLVAIISDGTTTACSTDSFSVRPLVIASVTSFDSPAGAGNGATNTGSSGSPIFKAGSGNFVLSAYTTGVAGSPSGYNGVMKINNAAITSSATYPGVVAGTFPAATPTTPATITAPASTATGTMFTYSEVGGFMLPGYNPATDTTTRRGVYDGVATADECTAPGLTTAQCDALKATTWTGVDSISTKGDCIVDSYSNTKVSGKYGCNFGLLATTAVFGRFVPDHFALSAGSIITRSAAACAPASSFTYMGEPMQLVFTLTAQNAANSTTLNYAGAYAMLDPTSLLLWPDSKLGVSPSIALGAIDTAAPTLLSTRMSVTAVAATGWAVAGSKGSNTITATANLARGAVPDGSYGSVKLGVDPRDSDGVKFASYDLDANNDATNERRQIGAATSFRFGRLRLSNAFGSEKANLQMPVQAQYWSGQSWVLNSDDSCTSLLSGNFYLVGAPAGTGASGVTIAAGAGTMTLTKPSPTATGVVDVAANLGLSGNDQSCLSTHGGTAASLPWLRSQNGNCAITYDRDPSARATFGIYAPETKKTIHVREQF